MPSSAQNQSIAAAAATTPTNPVRRTTVELAALGVEDEPVSDVADGPLPVGAVGVADTGVASAFDEFVQGASLGIVAFADKVRSAH